MGSKTRKPRGSMPLLLKLLLVVAGLLLTWLVWSRFKSHPMHTLRHMEKNTAAAATGMVPVTRPAAAGSVDVCHAEVHAEFEGELLATGENNLMVTAAECCAACQALPGCNVWVWCGQRSNCGAGRSHLQCWLKKQEPFNVLDIRGTRHPANPWTSGAIYTNQMLEDARAAEAARVDKLVMDNTLPMVFLDVAIKGQFIGRIKMVLFTKESPRAAENFRALCTGEKGIVPEGKEGAGTAYHFKGKAFYRIIDQFIDQTGAGTESVFGGWFKDDAGGLALKHDRKGLLSMANSGPDTNSSHFSIMLGPAPHLNGHYTIFGEVVSGFEVVEAINRLSKGKPNNFAGADAGAVIVDSGQIRCGEPCGAPELYKEAAEAAKPH